MIENQFPLKFVHLPEILSSAVIIQLIVINRSIGVTLSGFLRATIR